jgi:hypothetical protein
MRGAKQRGSLLGSSSNLNGRSLAYVVFRDGSTKVIIFALFWTTPRLRM